MTSRIRKLAVVIPRYGTVGGGEKFASELTERIASKRFFDIHVFSNKWMGQSDSITFHKIPIIIFPRFLTPISFAYFTNQKITKGNYDLVHTHERVFYADIFTMHSIPHQIWVKEVREKSMSLYDLSLSWVERCLVTDPRCRRFLPVSSLTKEKFLQEYYVDQKDTEVIHPGVEVDKFKRLDRQRCRQEVRRRFGIDESDIVILFVGMNFEIKGLDKLMSAMAITRSKYPAHGLKLLVVGKGNYKKYIRLAQKLGIKDDAIFTGIWKENIEQVFLASDIYSMLSKFDTFGMAVLEAMAASLPVIISSKVGAKDMVRPGVNGFIVENDNIDAISSIIEDLLDKDRRSEMARKAHETALENTWDKLAEKVMRVYEELMA